PMILTAILALAPAEDALFLIGAPDSLAAEFGLTGPGEGYAAYPRIFPNPVVYTVGKSTPKAWPYIHPAVLDRWAGGRDHTFAIRFAHPRDEDRPLHLVLGLAGGSPSQRSKVIVRVNGEPLAVQTAPGGDPRVAFDPTGPGVPDSMIFAIPAGKVRRGANEILIRLEGQSWIIYDYIALRAIPKPLSIVVPPEVDILAAFRAGPMAGVEEIVFAVRRSGEDPHWYANYGYTLDHSNWRTYLPGGRLCVLHLDTGKVTILLDDPEGNVRDPAVDYDGRTILFAYRKGASPHYHLYTIGADGSGLRPLTDGPFDDIEPIWLPDGDILFNSTRCKRRVNCHTTQSAILYRCDADGGDIRPLSSNNEPDNTPWVMPDGRILYTRWEYVDRDQLSFHHLWTMAPDGTRQAAFFGNQNPGTVMIDAKPIPGTDRIVASFSPGHGIRDHDGTITVVDPRRGPDDRGAARSISRSHTFRDPWAFSEGAFLVASGTRILLMDETGRTRTIHELSGEDAAKGLRCHEPRPLVARPREPIVAPGTDWREETGRLVLIDAHQGRNMAGVAPGEIREILVLETLPKPMNYTGGMEPLSYGGTFTLERILGTIPVEPDGSAFAELPALRSLVLVTLDGEGRSVKRMQSFVTVLPGETTTCIGCHEQRTLAPPHGIRRIAALRRPSSRLQPIADVPDVIDFPRDVQPILDRRCLPCHDDGRREGGIVLSGDRGPMFSISYYTLTVKDLVADGRNGLGNRPPRAIGSGGSRLIDLCDGSHHDARPTERERRILRLWIDTGAAHPGTYAALGTGMIGEFEIFDRSIRLDRSDTEWPRMKLAMAALERRCGECHTGDRSLPLSPSQVTGRGSWGTAFKGDGPWVALTPDDPRRRYSRHLFYNLTRPERSLILLAPLSKAEGGFASCGRAVFASADDPDFLAVLGGIETAKAKLEEIKRFDMPGFRPRPEYIEEMQRFDILPRDLPAGAPIDVYAVDRAYWRAALTLPARRRAPPPRSPGTPPPS
ncbi:MAG: PD40 domain-containing protein, partial [Planctomycetes bacterium]|nr:PD40 domain-containing protein [Planctomycetota bacterium]